MKSTMPQLKNALSFVLGAVYALIVRYAIVIAPNEEWSFTDLLLTTAAIVGSIYLIVIVIVFFLRHWDD